MTPISQREFYAATTGVTGSPFTQEREWYQHEKLYGTVLLDRVDRDWSFVMLADESDRYRAVDVGASFLTQEDARAALKASFTNYHPER
jgi:hypothetical protein